MAKVKKICAYKGCNPNDSNNETYFSFPSDPVRCQLWKDLSKSELAVPKYLCSKHFDKAKYMSQNPRRNILLNTAIPYPYEDNDEIQKDLIDSVEIQLDNSAITVEEEQTSSNIMKDDFLEINDKSIDLTDTNIIEYSGENTQERVLKSVKVEPYKRKSNIVMPISVKIKKIQNIDSVHPHLIISRNNSNYNVKSPKTISNVKNYEEMNNTNNSDSQITTFIFKGEEYIQMPKSLYLSEKSELEKKVQHYENIVYGIQNFLEKESEYKG